MSGHERKFAAIIFYKLQTGTLAVADTGFSRGRDTSRKGGSGNLLKLHENEKSRDKHTFLVPPCILCAFVCV